MQSEVNECNASTAFAQGTDRQFSTKSGGTEDADTKLRRLINYASASGDRLAHATIGGASKPVLRAMIAEYERMTSDVVFAARNLAV